MEEAKRGYASAYEVCQERGLGASAWFLEKIRSYYRKRKREKMETTKKRRRPKDADDADMPTTPTAAREPANPGEPKWPLFKVGPIATDKNNSVVACVWENEHATADGRTFKVHNVTAEACWYDADHENEDGTKGKWKSTKSFRGSQLYALIYCLERASDFILSQRDPQNDCPF